MNSTIY